MAVKDKIVSGVAQLWPRDVFNLREGNKYLDDVKEILDKKSGVYILYRDDKPYYIGKTKNLFKRLTGYARNPNSKRYHFWNYFTAFIVTKSRLIDDVEAILIRAMPLVDNSAKPKIHRIKIPKNLASKIRGKSLA